MQKLTLKLHLYHIPIAENTGLQLHFIEFIIETEIPIQRHYALNPVKS